MSFYASYFFCYLLKFEHLRTQAIRIRRCSYLLPAIESLIWIILGGRLIIILLRIPYNNVCGLLIS
jgi:hypothetical protein